MPALIINQEIIMEDTVETGEAKAFPRINPRTQRQEDVTIYGIKDGFFVWDRREPVLYIATNRVLGMPVTILELTEGKTAVAVSKR